MEIDSIDRLKKTRNNETDLSVIVNKPLLNVLFGWFGAKVNLSEDESLSMELEVTSLGKDQLAFMRAAVWGYDKSAPDYKDTKFLEKLSGIDISPEALIGNTHFLANLVRAYSLNKTPENCELLIGFGVDWLISGEKFVDHLLVRRMDRILNGETDHEDIISKRRQAAFTKALNQISGSTISVHQFTNQISESAELARAALLLNTKASSVAVNHEKITKSTAKPASRFMSEGTNCLSSTNQVDIIQRRFGKSITSYPSPLYNLLIPDLNTCLNLNGHKCRRIEFCRRPQSDALEIYAAEIFSAYCSMPI